MTTEPTERDLGADVHWNLGDLYSSIEDPRIEETLKASQARAEQFERDYKGRINAPGLTADVLGAALREYENIQQEASKPGYFASLLFTTDMGDPARGAFLQRMREQGTKLALPLLFFGLELAAVPDDVIGPLLDMPPVAPYKHFIGTVRAEREHMLSETEERLMEELANTGGRAFDRLFDETTAGATFVFGGEELSQAQVIAKIMDPDRETRRLAAAAFTEGLQKQSRTLTFIFNTLMQDKSVKDRLRGFATPQASRHLDNELSEETVSLVVDTVVRNYPLVARYYSVKREILGLDMLTHYDRYAPLFEAEGTITYPEAQGIVLDAFGDFSPEMRRRAAEFFDKNWIDAPAAKGKEGGAFCSYVTPDLHPYVLMNYLGRMKDVMTLAHELGHGVHASLSRSQSLLNFHGTLPLAELASTFGEMLVFERVTGSASLKDKLALYAEKIEGAFATIPRQTAMYRFERAIHEHRRTKGELTTEEFGEHWQREVQLMFGDSVQLGDEHRLWWSYIGHFIGSPFYVYAYSFGELLVLSLYQQAKKEGPAFADKYLRMLEAGGSLTPQELMTKVGVTLDARAFWQGGFDVLAGLVGEFEALWSRIPAKRLSAFRGLPLLAGLLLLSLPAGAQTFTADFGRSSGPPLVKTKFGVYQTPFLPPATQKKMMPLLQEAGVQDFRYEMAWGKPDAQAFDQIVGTAAKPVINFTPLDTLANGLKALGIHPLFAMTYDPLPLKTGSEWQRWKDVPSDLAAWGRINGNYAAHYRTALGLRGPSYEVWNEPDLPGDGGKVFFSGGPADYARVYAAAQAGLRAADPDALVGGPGIAYDTSYVAPALAHPMDFVSVHAYSNYAGQIRSVRPLLTSLPDLPVFLTEYASFKDFGARAPISRAAGAAAFFADVQGLLTFPDVPKVYWAQWADDALGMLTSDLHRKALFNALKVYQTLLPVDRNAVTPETQGGVSMMASSDDHAAAVILWNVSALPATLTVHLNNLPFSAGTLAVSRIDDTHASFVDDPATENLSAEAWQAVTSRAAVWAGTVPAHGVILLRATDTSPNNLLQPASIGTYVRTRWWFPDRSADSYADYDPRTCIARLGMGTRDFALAQIGVLLDRPAPRLAVQVTRQGTLARKDVNTLFGVRIDYETRQGWTHSALWHDGSDNSHRESALPWGKGGARADKSYAVPALVRGKGVFVLGIAAQAPPGWDGRILLTPILQNAGANAQGRLIFRPAPAAAGTHAARRRTPA